tara:strand:- start:422 stop:646 length:225 start_codon:yes stop_codon:yes gene_type:complete
MIYSIRKLIFALLFNSSILIMLIIGIQNSNNKNKVNLIVNETIYLPVGFIVGISFISGSLLGSMTDIDEFFKKK